jgi:hypothetical protein
MRYSGGARDAALRHAVGAARRSTNNLSLIAYYYFCGATMQARERCAEFVS